jgi:L,D-transpeptidase ErfK/SrfK
MSPVNRAAAAALAVVAFAGLTLPAVVQALEFPLSPDTEVVGEVQVIAAAYEDTFVRLARRYDVGYEELRQANPDVDPWLPGEGTQIIIPTQYVLPRAQRRGIVINVPELRLYYFPESGDRVITYPISIGKQDWATPYGTTAVVRKAVDPTWYPPASVRQEHLERNDPLPAVVPPGPDNPLGTRALYLGFPGYLLHGTNKPAGLGMRVTHGCVRLFPEDVEALFEQVAVGTPVALVNQPYKLGWGEDGLYLEAHRPLNEDVESGSWTATELTRIFVGATEQRQTNNMDWRNAESVMYDSRGVPQFVSIEPMQIPPVQLADSTLDPQ